MGMSLTSSLTPKHEDKLRPRFAQSNGLQIRQLNLVIFHVKRGGLNAMVDTYNKTCTCQAFDINKLLCVHAIATVYHDRLGVYPLTFP